MNYLNVENISKSYGELNLFEDLSFSIHKDQKIAFVAKNGTGKTSILNILSGKDSPDTGQIIYRKGLELRFYLKNLHSIKTLRLRKLFLTQTIQF